MNGHSSRTQPPLETLRHPSSRLQRRAAGFTLIELLVSMLIFAVLGTAAYQGLFQVQRVSEGVEAQSQQLARLQRAFYWLTDDIAQIAERPVRTTLGSQQPALLISEVGESFLEFTRAGWSNPAADVLPPRSNLQRVAYSLDGDRLLRKYWYHLDHNDDDVTKRRVLLEEVDDVKLRFLDAAAEWHDSWPPSSTEGEVPGLPAAIEFQLQMEKAGKITRLFALPG